MTEVTEERRLLSGWGRTAPSAATVRTVRSREQVLASLAEAPARGVIARGLGRSYGDLAQNAGGLILDLTGLAELHDFDVKQGVVTVGGGCSLERLLQVTLPAGWFLPVVPGTRFVTVGGAIACDVHGKNHHRDGSFGRHVRALTLATGAGEVRRLDPEGSPEEFWATVGGLGLTGVVLDATLQLLPVETAAMKVDVERVPDFDEALARLDATDHLHRYSVAWVDCLGRGARFGRSVLLRGDHALRSELPARARSSPLRLRRRPPVRVPAWAASAPLPRSGRAPAAFNELYFRRAREAHGELQSLEAFFWPLDGLRDWNRLYGRGGFLQYQCVVPFGREDVLADVLRLVAASGRPPLLAVMKRFGPGAGPLSFPLEGWTISLDVPLPSAGLARALDAADEQVASAGGRVYLAKDSRLRAAYLPAMYPRLDEWRQVQARLDPDGRMRCDLERRLRVAAPRKGRGR